MERDWNLWAFSSRGPPIRRSPFHYSCIPQEQSEKLFWYIKLSDPHHDDDDDDYNNYHRYYNYFCCTGLIRRFGDDISYTLVCFVVINKYALYILYTYVVETTNYITTRKEEAVHTFIDRPYPRTYKQRINRTMIFHQA
jgi:hypothetical protein